MTSYELFLRAFPLGIKSTRPSAIAALELLDRAIALDPNYAMAIGVAAICHAQLAAYGEPGHRAEAEALIHRALNIAPDDPEILQFAAGALFALGAEAEAALGLCLRSLELNPGHAIAAYQCGMLHQRIGRIAEASELIERSMRLDPLSPFRPLQLWSLGWLRLDQARHGEAVVLLSESAQLNPDFVPLYPVLAASQALQGDRLAARANLATFRDLTGLTAGDWARATHLSGEVLRGLALAEDGAGPSASYPP
jgi:tetratricopeptide (TPR) repeat protein